MKTAQFSFHQKTSKKLLYTLGSIFGLALLAIPSLSFAWDISSFKSDVQIQNKNAILVTETIVADYTGDPHHGPIRSIPVKYRDKYGNNLSLSFNLISVTDENGKPWTFEKSNTGKNVEIKIGDANVLLSKPSTYKITYEINRAVTYFPDHDELYWNVTGDKWDAEIKKAEANISFPLALTDSQLKADCFTGTEGSVEKNCTSAIKNGKIHFETSEVGGELYPGEGLTIVAGFPKNIVPEPTQIESLSLFIQDNWGYLLPFLVFGFLFYIWYTKGRDSKTEKDTVMAIYSPPENLSPAEIGTIVDERVDMQDITSTIIDLAIRGYLKIIETKEKKFLFETTDYEFKKLKDFNSDATLADHEKKTLDAVFGTSETRKLADLKQKFYKNLPLIKNNLYTQVVKKGYFAKNPDSVRNTYTVIGIILIAVPIFGNVFIISFGSISLLIGLAISGALFFIFARFMPAKTKKGSEVYYQILGLKEYISTAEKDRIKFQEKENIFEKLLPYAMVLGVAEKWTKSFEGLYKVPPTWYSSNDPNFMNNFSTYYLLTRLNSATGSMNTAFASSPRSASGGGSGFGGGFSGGGFGGGGGSSW